MYFHYYVIKLSHEFHRKITNKKCYFNIINTCTHKFEFLMSWTLPQMPFHWKTCIIFNCRKCSSIYVFSKMLLYNSPYLTMYFVYKYMFVILFCTSDTINMVKDKYLTRILAQPVTTSLTNIWNTSLFSLSPLIIRSTLL